jgi:hypothetical protein
MHDCARLSPCRSSSTLDAHKARKLLLRRSMQPRREALARLSGAPQGAVTNAAGARERSGGAEEAREIA